MNVFGAHAWLLLVLVPLIRADTFLDRTALDCLSLHLSTHPRVHTLSTTDTQSDRVDKLQRNTEVLLRSPAWLQYDAALRSLLELESSSTTTTTSVSVNMEVQVLPFGDLRPPPEFREQKPTEDKEDGLQDNHVLRVHFKVNGLPIHGLHRVLHVRWRSSAHGIYREGSLHVERAFLTHTTVSLNRLKALLHEDSATTRQVQKAATSNTNAPHPLLQGNPSSRLFSWGYLRAFAEIHAMRTGGASTKGRKTTSQHAHETLSEFALFQPEARTVPLFAVETKHQEIIPAYLIRYVPLSHSLKEIRDYVISAVTGDVMSVHNPVHGVTGVSVPAKVFPGEPPQPLTVHSAVDGHLTQLLRGAEGDAIRGKWFETHNCCLYVECTDQTKTRSTCPVAQKRCLPINETVSSGVAYRWINTIDLLVPLSNFRTDVQTYLTNRGHTGSVHFSGPVCSGLSSALVEGGVFDDVPADFPMNNASEAVDNDGFSEVQAYYSMMKYFNHVRSVRGNSSFCLRPEAMRCDSSGEPLMNSSSPPIASRAFFVATNILLPPDLNAMALSSVSGQGIQSNPLTWNVTELQKVLNAFFIEQLPSSYYSESPYSTMEWFQNRDLVGFFQSSTIDLSYDMSVVAHEFQHALTQTLNPTLKSRVMDVYGQGVDPSAMNEGWSDYFTASWLNNPVIGPYFRTGGLRDISQSKTCPSYASGQSHATSGIFSNVLWTVRASFSNNDSTVKAFDKLLQAAIATGGDRPTMSDMCSMQINLLTSNGWSGSVISLMNSTCISHGIGNGEACSRLLSSINQDAVLYAGTSTSLGFSSTTVVPTNMQLALPLAQGDVSLTFGSQITVEDAYGFGVLDGIKKAQGIFGAIISLCPVHWSSNAGVVTATGCIADATTRVTINLTSFHANYVQATASDGSMNFVLDSQGSQRNRINACIARFLPAGSSAVTVYVAPVITNRITYQTTSMPLFSHQIERGSSLSYCTSSSSTLALSPLVYHPLLLAVAWWLVWLA